MVLTSRWLSSDPRRVNLLVKRDKVPIQRTASSREGLSPPTSRRVCSGAFRDRPRVAPSQQASNRLVRVNLLHEFRRRPTYSALDYDWTCPPCCHLAWVLRRRFKIDGELTPFFLSTLTFPLFLQWFKGLPPLISLHARLLNVTTSMIRATTYSCFIPPDRQSNRPGTALSLQYVQRPGSSQGPMKQISTTSPVPRRFLQPPHIQK